MITVDPKLLSSPSGPTSFFKIFVADERSNALKGSSSTKILAREYDALANACAFISRYSSD